MEKNKKTTETLVRFMTHIIDRLRANGQHQTMLHYRATLNSFLRFTRQRDIALTMLNADTLLAYEAYLRHQVKVCRNTSSFYLRILRSVYNQAVAQGHVVQQYPFRHVYTGIDKTRKRAITLPDIRRIKHCNLRLSPSQELSRDMFLMSFLLRGMSFVDMAHLRKANLHDGYLHYVRSKTGQLLKIKWQKEMQEIVDKYRHLTAPTDYLLPLLTEKPVNKCSRRDAPPAITHQHLCHNAASRLSYHLKMLGEKTGVSGKLTLYVARHTWATVARDHGIPISVISEALGHDSEHTTQIYLRSIRTAEVDQANAEIIAAL